MPMSWPDKRAERTGESVDEAVVKALRE